MINVEILQFEPFELVTCDKLLLADSMLKKYCIFVSDDKLDNNEPLIKQETDLSHISDRTPFLSNTKQIVLVRSCLADVLYSIHILGLWPAQKTVKLYLTEFSRLVKDDPPAGDLIATTLTILNHLYGRLDEIISRFECANSNPQDLLLKGSSPQLRSLLHYIKDFKPPPNASWPVCIVHVRKKVIAKVIALWLNEVASNIDEFSFIKPNYIVGTSRKHRNRMAIDNFDLHHEASIRDFRFGKCNTLVVSTINERCADMLKCNLVLSFDLPTTFSDFMQAKSICRHESGKYVIMYTNLYECNFEQKIFQFSKAEQAFNGIHRRDVLESDEAELMKSLEPGYPPYPSKQSKGPATIWRGVSIINRYCTKLPSDSFTKLSPNWCVKEIVGSSGQKSFYCEVRLPINSPVRQTIVGPEAPTKSIATRLAAFTACQVLHKAGELDDNMLPIKKESMKIVAPWLANKEFIRNKPKNSVRGQSVGSTKHRQYYKKRIAKVFSGPLVSSDTQCFLYKFKMVLTCPIPDEQNRRGRRIIDPSETSRNYAIVCTSYLPKICSFPVFTRSGEVLISIELVSEDFKLTKDQVSNLRIFHEYTFSSVLKLEKYPTLFDPDNSPFTVLLAPVLDLSQSTTTIDWDFVDKIVKSHRDTYTPDIDERKNFKFEHERYVDAVVIPWYRLTDRQQFAYYVAEICTSMNPGSPFPDVDSGFETFVDYYRTKYNIEIFNKDQPVLDVDHTSARLNLLTPRYVNRKGRTLPSSTAKTRRESRESLVQKQLLIPELCTIHPFPASFWRKAVCLPCIFYRLNSLFLAEELRREVARDIKVGFVEPPQGFDWPQLDFGWSLKDVINGQTDEINDELQNPSESLKNEAPLEECPRKSKDELKEEYNNHNGSQPSEPTADFVIDHFDPSKYDIPDIPLDAPPEEWMNIKLISTSNSGTYNGTGWDQPIEQRDLFLRHSNEITWSDCEMEFDGEITEKVNGLRCGSPSSFEPGTRRKSGKPLNGVLRPKENGVHRAVRFEKDSDDCDDLEGTFEIPKRSVDSDSSWSLSGDDDVEDDDGATYADWKDTKFKNQSLLRELFVPFVRTNNTRELDDQRQHNGDVDLGDCSEPFSEEYLKKMGVVIVRGEPNHVLSDVLETVFEEKLTIDENSTRDCLQEWFSILRRLEAHVERTLTAKPELFKDNDVELIAVEDSLSDYNLEMQPTFGELLPNRDTNCDWPSEDWKNIKFDPNREEMCSSGPGPSVILQALTMSNASDGINLERLETVGDSFLKYSITAYLYCMYPSMHEGKLSYLRSSEISNANLYHLGKSKNLGELMSATKFEPNDNWLPPGYSVSEASNQLDLPDNRSNKKREIDKALAEVPYDLLRQHSIPDKSIADCVEALIGAYLTASGSRAALLFMQWLGLNVIPPTFDLEKDIQNGCNNRDETIWRWLEMPPSPLICTLPYYSEKAPKQIKRPVIEELSTVAAKELDRLYKESNMSQFERDIQYSFKDKAYLVQAFTHNSFSENQVTDCHQRLEFLGDALLDYLITRYLFEDPRCHSPGTLTDLRSALVNNTFFASLAVKYEFHKYLKFISDELYHVIEGFVKKFRFDSKDTITKGYTLLISEGESEYAEDIEVPKALGDVFESVAGAIYLDSGMSLDQVWQVYFKMMKPEIEYFSSHVPKSPIRELLESMPQNVRFSPSELAPDRKHRVTAEVFGLGRFTGVGRNKHSAKSTAAKRALRMLALRRRKQKQEQAAQR